MTAPTDGQRIEAGTRAAGAAHPGHSPGSVCWYAPDLGAVFSGDTLFEGGPGATGRSYSDFPTILESIGGRLGTLPGDTVVYTGHGDATNDRRRDRPLRRMGRQRSLTAQDPAFLGRNSRHGVAQRGQRLELLEPRPSSPG